VTLFDPRRLAFTWQGRADAPPPPTDRILAAAERHLQQLHARIERAADARSLRFGRGSGMRRNWLGAIGDGRLQVDASDGRLAVTVHAAVARMLLICALPALLLVVLGAWFLALPFILVAAGNLWFVDQGARRLIAAALGDAPP
jgi:hypothetical protein